MARTDRQLKFSKFIQANLAAILEERDAFAKTLVPVAATMSDVELRDHAREVLLAICEDMELGQTEQQRSAKSKQMVQSVGEPTSAAANHGGDRQQSGFNLMQLVGEFRALRASVLLALTSKVGRPDTRRPRSDHQDRI